MKTSKVIALFLAMVMLLSCMTACGQKQETTEEPDPAPATEPEQTQEPAKEQETEPAEETEESYLPLVKNGEETITIGIMQDVDTVDYETNEYTQWLEEQTGISIDFVYFSNDGTEASQQLAMMMNAGEKLPDILWHFSGINLAAGYEYGEDGYFIDMIPLIEKYGKYYVEARDSMSSESDSKNLEIYGTDPSTGALYAMPAYQISNSMDLITNHLMINKAWLDAVGEDVPTTVDELVNVLTKFVTEDPNGNGVKDEMGMVGNIGRTRGNILEYVINAYVYCNDNYRYNIGADGELYLPYTTDEYRQALIKLNEMYANGLIAPVSFTLKDDSETMAIFTPADGVSLAGVAAGHPVLITAEESENCFEYVGLPALEAETELGGYEASQSATFSYCTYITEDCENPELAFKLLDFMYCEESVIRMRYGTKGVHWDYAPEGSIDEDGEPFLFWLYDTSVFAGQNNVNWHVMGSSICDYGTLQGRWYSEDEGESELTWAERKSIWMNDELFAVWKASPKNDNAFYRNVYNAEENEAITTYNTTFLQYVEEARALFVTGTVDPSNDNDWNQYLSNLEAEGMSDLLASARSAYNRMNGK